ncbi:MAG: lytic transglycosylase domain-containing protein [Desulfobacterales bacterium]
MLTLKNLTKLIICLLLLGYGQPGFSSVKTNEPDVEALWDRYLSDDARKSPAIQYPFERCFKLASVKYSLPLTLLLAVARGESDFNPNAKSDRNCHGLMQILWPQTAKHLGIDQLEALYDPCTNILAGARYIRELMDRYNDNLHLTLAAYNYGPNRIRKNTASNSMPQGAQWYSSYIYHHLKYIMRWARVSVATSETDGRLRYIPKQQLEIITFTKPYRAAGFYQYLKKRAPGLNIDWYRMGLGRYQVVMRYTDERTLKNGKKKLRNLGIRVKGR